MKSERAEGWSRRDPCDLLQLSALELAEVVAVEPQNPLLEVLSPVRREARLRDVVASRTSLGDELRRQLWLASSDPEELIIGEVLIGSLDDDGYLREELAEIAELVATPVERVEGVLRILQGCEPAGIAARSLRECLLLQLRAAPTPDPVAIGIVEQHLENLERRRYGRIAHSLRVSRDRIVEAVERLRHLEPRPGRAFDCGTAPAVVPDVILQKVGGAYEVTLNQEVLPHLRIRPRSRSLIGDADPGGRRDLEDELSAATWLIEQLELRSQALRAVASSIVRRRTRFLDGTAVRLSRLRLGDIVRDTGVDQSAIRRVANCSYLETPRGIFKLSRFVREGDEGEGDGGNHHPTPPRPPAAALALPVPAPPFRVISPRRILAGARRSRS